MVSRAPAAPEQGVRPALSTQKPQGHGPRCGAPPRHILSRACWVQACPIKIVRNRLDPSCCAERRCGGRPEARGLPAHTAGRCPCCSLLQPPCLLEGTLSTPLPRARPAEPHCVSGPAGAGTSALAAGQLPGTRGSDPGALTLPLPQACPAWSPARGGRSQRIPHSPPLPSPPGTGDWGYQLPPTTQEWGGASGFLGCPICPSVKSGEC